MIELVMLTRLFYLGIGRWDMLAILVALVMLGLVLKGLYDGLKRLWQWLKPPV